MKVDDIVIRDKSRATGIKYRITRLDKIGDVPILWGYRVKYDKRCQEWISFGNERAIRPRDYRLFVSDDYHYIK